ncbi:MAG: biotin/lipoyl-containing protein [Anaerolineae bacterium]
MSTYQLTIDGQEFVVEVGDVTKSPVQVTVNGETHTVSFQEGTTQAATPAPKPVAAPAPKPTPKPAPAPVKPAAAGEKPVIAPMPGKILSVRVKVGDKVSEGDTVCTLEAMKMEMPISSTASGTVQGIHVAVGDTVAFDAPLITIG